jgi:hypothetical protein
LRCTRKTAAKYLDTLVGIWILEKYKVWRESYYVNVELFTLLQNVST